jgi:tRNA(fMet)-specific endonuclease VapC
MICLDTNVVIAYLKGVPMHLVARFQHEIRREQFSLSTVTLFELHYGIAKSTRRKSNANRLAIFLQLPITVLPFEPEDAEDAGEIRAELERKGKPIGSYDLLIAAQARRRSALLVMANASEFSRVPGLKIQDWAEL